MRIHKYIRLLSYENACLVINHIRQEKSDNAYITTGGVAIDVSESNYDSLIKFIESLNVRYEIGDVPPYIINRHIIEEYKSSI